MGTCVETVTVRRPNGARLGSLAELIEQKT